MKHAKEMRRHVEAVVKALDILDCFQRRPVLTLNEIVDVTGLTRSRVMRLTGTLESRGYLHYDSGRKYFSLGSRVMMLGKIFELHNTLISISRPILRDLVQMTREVASLYVIDGMERVALAREKSPQEISYSVADGQRMEIYAGAAGKVLLAYAPSEISEKVLSVKFLKKLTPMTFSNPEDMAKELETIRRNGYGESQGERVSDVWSAAAPVFDREGEVCCAIGITGPIYRIPAHVRSNYITIVVQKSIELSQLLGART